MDLHLFLKYNIEKISNIVAKCLRFTLYLLLIIWGLGFFNLINVDKAAITLCLAISGILLLIPTLYIDVFNVQKNYVMYIVVVCTTLVVGVMSSFLSYYVAAFVLFPLLLASLYYNRVLVLFTSLIGCCTIIASTLLCVNIGIISNDPFRTGYEEALLYGALPKILILLFMSIISYFIVDRNNEMMADIFLYSNQLKISQEEIILSFSDICESKSKSTGEHVRRVSKYMRVLCEASGFDPNYVDIVCTASMMHDIGKLMIPEEILNKPGKLNEEEYAVVRNHVLYGEALLHNATGEVMEIARTIALQHHERWDGKGYLGMKGDEIAYICRLMALADVFDALSASRCYKDGWSLQETYQEIIKGKGTQFDPVVVDLFEKNYDKFVQIFNDIPDNVQSQERMELR